MTEELTSGGQTKDSLLESQGTASAHQANPPATSHGAAAGGDRFHGKSREEVIAMLSENERRLNELTEESNAYRTIVSRIQPYFDLNGDYLTLNEDVAKQYAISRGWISKDGNDTSNDQPSPLNPQDEMQRMEQNPKDYIRNLIRDEIQGAFKENLDPFRQQFMESQHQSWIREVTNHIPNFNDYRVKVGKWIQQHNFPVNSAADLKTAALAVMAEEGSMIPKADADQHIKNLEATLRRIDPTAYGPQLEGREPTNEEIMGMHLPGDEKQKSNIRALFGKELLRD